MTPLRIWEFLIGYGAAIFLTNKGDVRFPNLNWLGMAGFILLLSVPIFNVDGQSLNIINGHPGLYALLISISTGLVLIFGLPKVIENSIFGKGLVVLGKYSYSIYLVHFPIIVLYLSSPFSGTVLTIQNIEELVILTLLISLASILLHRYVEARNFRINILSLSALASSLIVILSLSLPAIQIKIIPAEEAKIFSAFQDRSTYRCGKLVRVIEPGIISCELTGLKGNIKDKLMLVGDSHSDSIKTSLARIAKENGSSLHFIVQNDPLMRGGIPPTAIVNEAISKGISHIILHYSPSAVGYEIINELAALSEENNIDVIFIHPVPVWTKHIPQMMYQNLNARGENIIQTKHDYLTQNAALFSEIDAISASNFRRVNIVDYFCKPECMYKTEDGVPLYFDNGHLTLTGSYILKDVFTQIINDL